MWRLHITSTYYSHNCKLCISTTDPKPNPNTKCNVHKCVITRSQCHFKLKCNPGFYLSNSSASHLQCWQEHHFYIYFLIRWLVQNVFYNPISRWRTSKWIEKNQSFRENIFINSFPKKKMYTSLQTKESRNLLNWWEDPLTNSIA